MEDDLDFVTAMEVKQADQSVYDPDIARTFFLNNGKPATLKKDGVLFVEQTAGDRMYFILRGELGLSVDGKSLDVIRAGEIVGEMSVISGASRAATATAKSDCMLIAMEAPAFREALVNHPEFAAMLMHMMLSRLRLTLSVLRIRGRLATAAANMSGCVLHNTLMINIATELGEKAITKFPKGRTIIVEGTSGSSMYAILEGTVSISIQGRVIETAGPGGVFGEMALIDAAPRAASVAATSDCKLLSLNKESFLSLVRSNPAFGIGILRGFAERMRYLNTLRS